MLVGQQFQQNTPNFHYICMYPHNCKLFSTTRPFSVEFGGLFIHTTCWHLRIHIVIKSFCIIYYPHSSTHYGGSQIYNLQDLLFIHFGYSQPTHKGSYFDMYVYRVIYRHMSAIYNVSFAVYVLFSEIIGKP